MSKYSRALLWILLNLIITLNSLLLSNGAITQFFIFPVASLSRIVTRSESLSTSTESLQKNIAAIRTLHGINYYPSSNLWYYMWKNWNKDVIDSDFAKISSGLHANYVRIIVPADINFGYPTPYLISKSELSQILELANKHGLKVDLTLFDLFSNYTDLNESKQWVSSVLNPYKNDPRIAFIDLQNELNNTNPTAVSWEKTMIPYVRTLIGDIPITVSVAGPISNLALQVSNQVPVDFYEFHFYMNSAIAYLTFQEALHIVSTSKILMIGETGYSTLPTNKFLSNVSQTQTSQEAEQDQYIRTVEYAAQRLGLPLASPWNYSDFANNANVLNGYLGTAQQHFGLYRSDGTLKPAGLGIRSIFSGYPIDLSFNNSFENCDNTNLPVLWRIYQNALEGFKGNFACDSSVSHSGLKSVRISDSFASNKGAPGFYLSPIQYIIPNLSYTATVWVKGMNLTGNAHISLSWFDKNQVYLGKNSSINLSKSNTNWTQLSVTAIAPVNAASLEIHLEVTGTNTGTVWFDDVTFTSTLGINHIIPTRKIGD